VPRFKSLPLMLALFLVAIVFGCAQDSPQPAGEQSSSGSQLQSARIVYYAIPG